MILAYTGISCIFVTNIYHSLDSLENNSRIINLNQMMIHNMNCKYFFKITGGKIIQDKHQNVLLFSLLCIRNDKINDDKVTKNSVFE